MEIRKFKIAGVTFVLFTLIFAVLLVITASAKTLHYAAQGSSVGTRAEVVKWWASEVEEQTKGDIDFKFHWNGSLLKPGDAMKGIGMGNANVGEGWGIYHPAKTPLWTVADPPFSHEDPWVGLMVMYELFNTYEPLIAELEKYNVKLLAPFVTGMTQLGSREGVDPIILPDDAKGKKIRFAGGAWAKFWKSLDAVPVSLTQGEVYEGMMRGTVDATQSYFFILEAYKHWDVIKNYTVANAGELASYGLIINIDDYNNLSEKEKNILDQVSRDMMNKYAKALIQDRVRIREIAKEKGVKFHELSDDQRQKWVKKAEIFMDRWAEDMDDKGLPGTEIQNKFMELRAKYNRILDEKGYPWER